MILTVTGNPALDVSYRVPELRAGQTHRVRTVHERAGGKGLNVSRVLHERGVPTLALGPVGGILGDSLRADLAEAGVPHDLLPVAAPTRMTIAVVDDLAEATLFTEPGGPLSPVDWERLVALVDRYLDDATVLVCSGSLPAGAPVDGYADLVARAKRAGVPTIVDATGPALLAAAAAGADIVKPNLDELRATVGSEDPAALTDLGAAAAVVSLGADGLRALTPEGRFTARPPHRVAGNPTGAGDAAVAALAHTEGLPWPERLGLAVAWSAAAVAAPLAGSLDTDVLAEIADAVEVLPG
ncbi:1-phosphofructokinase family hexose kinase [Actinokineospora sp. G85]|uniref:1-phosphofructokinase family hexose kinase n=1 Tax=Actinokineospora sp. G85 TaxID=3406626 RepID=UPI003C7783E8